MTHTLRTDRLLLAQTRLLSAAASFFILGSSPFLQSAPEPPDLMVGLQQRIEQGQVELSFEPNYGYLRSILRELQIPETSQLLVFSKTSCQRDKISPQTPRAVYFNHRSYVAWIPDSPLLEISCADPKEGAVFYTVGQKQTPRPQITRRDQCLECHTSTKTLSVPGYLVRSYATDRNGVIDITDGFSMIDHRTPFADRWGGWYICGTADAAVYRGRLQNTPSPVSGNPPQPESPLLDPVVDLSRYPQPTSDLVALMVLEHQAHMQNLITRLAHASRKAGAAGPDKVLSDELLRYLLFLDETPLNTHVEGGPGFVTWFEGQGPKDLQGRSLRQFDLRQRLFKYPCSYMIYSEAFDALPRGAKLHLYHRLWKILHGEDPAFSALPTSAGRAILEILIATKPDVPVYWKL